MRERVGSCVRCTRDVYCTDGFLNGIILENGNILCFNCKDHDPLIEILNQLLEAEKAGVATLDYLQKTYPSSDLQKHFTQIKQDEAWSCNGLIQALQREGGTPSTQIGAFVEKVKAEPSLPQKLSLLNRGQAWVARKIETALSLGMDRETREFFARNEAKA